MTQRPELSVIVPMYDEEACAASSISRIEQEIGTVCKEFEVVAVDDGSRDSTLQLITGALQVYRNLQVVHHPKNRGKGIALVSGIRACHGEYVGFIDADLQYAPKELAAMLDHITAHGCDVVNGERDRSKYPRERLIVSIVYNLLVRRLFGVPTRDSNSGIKLMRDRAARDTKGLEFAQVMMIPYLHLKGYRICSFPVALAQRTQGTSKYFDEAHPFGGAHTIRDIARGIRALFALLLSLPG